MPPGEVLTLVESAFSALSFQILDRNEAAGFALFRAEDSCLTKDLPEPYGKWFQTRERRPRWDEPVDLAVEVRCKTSTRATEATALTFEISALAPPLIFDLLTNLRRTPRLRTLYGSKGKRELGATLAAGIGVWLNAASRIRNG